MLANELKEFAVFLTEPTTQKVYLRSGKTAFHVFRFSNEIICQLGGAVSNSMKKTILASIIGLLSFSKSTDNIKMAQGGTVGHFGF